LDLKATISVSEFWQYSLHYYTQNNNQTTLLWLQDNAALNVNIVLLLMYLQTKSMFISVNQFNDLNQKNQALDSLTSNFREKRRVLKADNIDKEMADYRTVDYQELLQQELDLEKQQQAQLINVVSEFINHTHGDATCGDRASMDIKYYLLTLVVSVEGALVTESENRIDILIKEQQNIAHTFGQNQ
jgi:uncharacterized protein (TIGR02444 family)